MKNRNQPNRQVNILCIWACLIFILPASFAVAQEAPQAEAVDPAVEKIVGTWKFDKEKSKEVMSEEKISRENDFWLVFGPESHFSMWTGSGNVDLGLDCWIDAPYTISAVEDEKNLYSIVLQRPTSYLGRSDGNHNHKALFMDENTVKFWLHGEEPAIILTRSTEEDAEAVEAEAREFLGH